MDALHDRARPARCRCSWAAPPAHLATVIEGAWELHGDWRGADYLLPDTSLDVVVRLEGEIETFHKNVWTRLPSCAVIGSLSQAAPLRQCGRVHVVGVRIMPAQAIRLGAKASELRDRIVSLADMAPKLEASVIAFAEGVAMHGVGHAP